MLTNGGEVNKTMEDKREEKKHKAEEENAL